MAGTDRSGRPDAAQREAAHKLDVRKRMRLAEEAILARAPEHDLEPSLDRIAAVMELLGDPQRGYPVIHLTGTNGKTSTTRIIESLLREMGLRTGRFTSRTCTASGSGSRCPVSRSPRRSSSRPTRTCCPSSRWSTRGRPPRAARG